MDILIPSHLMRGASLILTVLLLCGCNKSTGRYEIRTAIYDRHFMDVNGNATTVQPHAVFKIDTVTGQTWVFRSLLLRSTTNEVNVETWEEIK
jgi:hypothetical protein